MKGGGLMKIVNGAYDIVVGERVPLLSNAIDLADEFRRKSSGVERAIDRLIRKHVIWAASAGFVTGLGGLLTLPVAVPGNVLSVYYLQLRMIAAIAYLRGFDPKDEKVRGLAYACLLGSGTSDVLKDVGIKAGTRMTQAWLAKLPAAFFFEINKAVGFRLMARAGSRGLFNMVDLVPLVGGAISGGVDAAATKVIGEMARKLFQEEKKEERLF